MQIPPQNNRLKLQFYPRSTVNGTSLAVKSSSSLLADGVLIKIRARQVAAPLASATSCHEGSAAELGVRVAVSGRRSVEIEEEHGEVGKAFSSIDSLQAVPLLFWAASQTGDDSYRECAASHTSLLKK